MSGGDDAYAQWDAAYVLGALRPQERREFERHLAGCESCREAVAELAGMPAVLSELSTQEATALLPAAEPAGEVVPIGALARAAKQRAGRRRWWLGAAAAGLVVAGGLGGTALSHLGGGAAADDVTLVSLTPVQGSDVSADLTLTPSTWGTRMEWSCSYPAYPAGPPPAGAGVYELVVIDDDGTSSVVATWAGDGTEHASGLLASSAIDVDDISRIELAVADSDVVLAAADLTDA